MITFINWDLDTEPEKRPYQLPSQIDSLTVNLAGERVEILVNGVVAFCEVEGTRDCQIYIDRKELMMQPLTSEQFNVAKESKERMFAEVVLREQLLPDSCVCACLAMVASQDQQTLIDLYNTDYHEGRVDLGGMLDQVLGEDQYKTWPRVATVSIGDMPSGALLVSVPSLNLTATWHQILILWNAETLEWRILDPNNGREGKRYYVGEVGDDPLAVEFGQTLYSLDALIPVSYWMIPDSHWLPKP